MTITHRVADRPRFSVCQNVLPNEAMAADLDIAAAAGVRAVGVLRAVMERTGVSETVRLMRSRSLVAASYTAPVFVINGKDTDVDEALRVNISEAAAVGSPILGVGPGPLVDRSASACDDIFVERLSRVAPLAKEMGVTLSIEPLHPLDARVQLYPHSPSHRRARLASRQRWDHL